MTITLELPPANGGESFRSAKARGLPLDAFLRTVIANQAASADTAGKLFQALQGEELDRAIDEIFDIVHVPPGVGRERCIVKTGIDDRRRHQRLGWFNPDV